MPKTHLQDLSDAIYRRTEPKKSDQKQLNDIWFTTSKQSQNTTQYNDKEYHTFSEEEDHAYAYAEAFNNKHKYKIKIGPSGEIYNPYDLGSNNHAIGQMRNGIPLFRWREINMTGFHYYIEFLRTSNVAFLRNAEREIRS